VLVCQTHKKVSRKYEYKSTHDYMTNESYIIYRCVNKKGEPIKGTMTNGIPNCQTRRGRLLGASSTVTPTGTHLLYKSLSEKVLMLAKVFIAQ